ncbi:hypothetical protein K4K49_001354 [Colletotrichum sp. SAR 10_70]|nr:hypothetical protein K4K50_012069 [Colletotrichum sp. SAR 10_71]KAI8180704.1 hypothetical protein K4K49_001354 [Colletotrichum sp. SAR 10_70]KAI8193897.1 hypothetical protein KHU50_012182 [Colletotrichum sp. SAR 10_65]KAI8210866.1 hypothetical protein K4K52_011487 [Colletotrichum sp. SAR 10_76]KAJ5000593.1 hypothetical protein K4K48_002432 [Colletotrichum sp. SAR 10_66]
MSAPNDQTSTPGDQPNAPAVSGGTENPRPNAEVDNEVQIAADVTDDQPAADGNIAAADAAAGADDQDDDAASEIQSRSLLSSTASVTSSVMEFRLENGRTYHGYNAGKYMMPNDEKEVDRLDLQHNLFLRTFDDRLATAPPNNPGAKVGRVLDVGTGSGIWAMDFGDEHPEAEVRGFDLSPVQPEYTPPNVRFEVADLEDPWTWSQPFDYIHSRMMNSSISNWKEYFKKCYDNLNPGGYFELVEPDIIVESDDGTLKPEHSIVKTGHLMVEATENAGRKYTHIPTLKPILMETGFEHVTMQQFKWPVNPWPKDQKFKELGYWHNENLFLGWEAICMAPLTRGLGWTREEVLVLLAQNRRDFNDRSIHAYFSIWTIYGKKPYNTEDNA